MSHSPSGRALTFSRRTLIAGAAVLPLAACQRRNEAEPGVSTNSSGDPDAPEGSLAWAVGGDWRADDRLRDVWRHPIETLNFFGLQPEMTVVEFWPGAGWWTEILAPYLARGGGVLHAASFQTGPDADAAQTQIVARFRHRFTSNRRLYGEVIMGEFGPTTGPVAPAGSADMALFMRNLHNWMSAGIVEKAFADAFAALKPGGALGIEQHRADMTGDQDPAASNGYVQEAYVKQLAAEAGFVYEASSEVNANPRDTRDHPFGVWTLPPQRMTAPRGAPPDPEFDRTPYEAIGESDRMTLRFRKPE